MFKNIPIIHETVAEADSFLGTANTLSFCLEDCTIRFHDGCTCGGKILNPVPLTPEEVKAIVEACIEPIEADIDAINALLDTLSISTTANSLTINYDGASYTITDTDTDTDTSGTTVDNGDGTSTITFPDGTSATFSNDLVDNDNDISLGNVASSTTTNPDGSVTVEYPYIDNISGDPTGDVFTITFPASPPAQILRNACDTEDLADGDRVLQPTDTNVVTAQSATQSIRNILRSTLAAVPERTKEMLLEDPALLTINNPYTCASLRNNIDFGGMAVARYDTLNINWASANADIVTEMEIFNAANGFVFGKRMEYTSGYANRQYHGERYAAESHVVTSIPAGGSLTIGGRINYTNWHFGPPAESVPARVVAVLPIIYYTGHPIYS